MEVVGPRPGFPAVLDTSNTDSTLGEGSSSQVHDNVHVQDRPMDRYEAERLEKRKRGICYWLSRGIDSCKFGENCKFIHSKDDVVLQSRRGFLGYSSHDDWASYLLIIILILLCVSLAF